MPLTGSISCLNGGPTAAAVRCSHWDCMQRMLTPVQAHIARRGIQGLLTLSGPAETYRNGWLHASRPAAAAASPQNSSGTDTYAGIWMPVAACTWVFERSHARSARPADGCAASEVPRDVVQAGTGERQEVRPERIRSWPLCHPTYAEAEPLRRSCHGCPLQGRLPSAACHADSWEKPAKPAEIAAAECVGRHRRLR